MADESNTEFASELRHMSDAEVRQQIDPSAQPVPLRRSMAVTEIEKRRQKRTNALLKRRIDINRIVVWTAWGAVIAALAAAVVWFA